MKITRLLMGMPITVEVADARATARDIDKIFSYFKYVDEKFSTYKEASEISRINKKQIAPADYSEDMKEVFRLSADTKLASDGYFDIKKTDGSLDPSGIVKGWAILNAAILLKGAGFENYYVEAGGDIQVSGKNGRGEVWSVGIRNPFKLDEIVKVIRLENEEGVATSGTYLRGQHIYNPKEPNTTITDIVSLTVIGPDILEADRFATAAFAMGTKGINYIENLPGFEGYMIDKNGVATMTTNFSKYVVENTNPLATSLKSTSLLSALC